jgi:DNA repair protein RadC
MLPREKLKQRGVGSLTNSELLAIILTTGTRKENILTLADRLIDDYIVGDASLNSSYEEIAFKFKLPPVKSMQLAATFEIGKRIFENKSQDRPLLNTSEKVFRFFKSLTNEDKEKMYIALIDSRFRLIKSELIAVGGLNLLTIDIRDVFSVALKFNAAGIILIHNHPSGDPKPSKEDIDFTQRVLDASSLLGLALIDHLIIGNSFYSFKESSKLRDQF